MVTSSENRSTDLDEIEDTPDFSDWPFTSTAIKIWLPTSDRKKVPTFMASAAALQCIYQGCCSDDILQ